MSYAHPSCPFYQLWTILSPFQWIVLEYHFSNCLLLKSRPEIQWLEFASNSKNIWIFPQSSVMHTVRVACLATSSSLKVFKECAVSQLVSSILVRSRGAFKLVPRISVFVHVNSLSVTPQHSEQGILTDPRDKASRKMAVASYRVLSSRQVSC